MAHQTMIQQRTPFSWAFTDEQRRKVSIFRSPVSGRYCLQRKENDQGYTYLIRTLSSHETLEQAIAASELLLELAK